MYFVLSAKLTHKSKMTLFFFGFCCSGPKSKSRKGTGTADRGVLTTASTYSQDPFKDSMDHVKTIKYLY